MADFRKMMLDRMTPMQQQEYLQGERKAAEEKAKLAAMPAKEFLRALEYNIKNHTSAAFSRVQEHKVYTYEDAFLAFYLPELMRRFADLTKSNLGVDEPKTTKTLDDTGVRASLLELD